MQGELITVKEKSLLLMDSFSGADVSVEIKDVREITILKKSKVLMGAGIGVLVGGIGGAGGIVLGAVAGLAIGGIAGAVVSADKTILIEGRSEGEIAQEMEKLRKMARIPDYN